MATTKDDSPQVQPSLKSIEEALNQIDPMKEALKKAYDDLHHHSSHLLPSFSWSQLDFHFTSIHAHLIRRFLLQNDIPSSRFDPSKNPGLSAPSSDPSRSTPGRDSSLPTSSSFLPRQNGVVDDSGGTSVMDPDPGQKKGLAAVYSDPAPSEPTQDKADESGLEAVSPDPGHGTACQDPVQEEPVEDSGVIRSEMIALCEKMDGKGLRDYLIERRKERGEIRSRGHLLEAIRVAPDPGLMVLEAMEGYYSSKHGVTGDKNKELFRVRKGCLEMLEAMVEIKPNVSDEVREGAKKLALEWKGKMHLEGSNSSEPLGFLNLVVGYRLENEFDAGKLVDCLFAVARCNNAVLLCKAMNLGEKAVDLVQRLIDNGKWVFAVKLILEWGMTDKFQPVPLLKAHLNECKTFASDICKDKKSSVKQQIQAISREINALRSIIQIINEHKLEAEYPPLELQKRVEMLEKQKINKRNSETSANRTQQQQKQHLKQPKKQQQHPAKPQHQLVKQQSKQQKLKQKFKQQQHIIGNKRARTAGPAGHIDVPNGIVASSSIIPLFQQSHSQPAPGSYGLVGSTPPIAPYAGSSVGPYGLARPAGGLYGNPNPTAVTHPFAQESYLPSGYYDGQAGYGGYGLPSQCHPAYYPR